MQIRRRRAAEPGIISNIYQKIGSLGDKLASQVREDPLIAYQHPKFFLGKGEDRRDCPGSKVTDALDQLIKKEEHAVVKRNVLTKWHELHLIVEAKYFGIGRNQVGTVEEGYISKPLCPPANAAEEQRGLYFSH